MVQFAAVQYNASVSSSNSIGLNYGTGINAGDLLVLFVGYYSNTNSPGAYTSDSGWTKTYEGGSGSEFVSVLYKTATGSENSSNFYVYRNGSTSNTAATLLRYTGQSSPPFGGTPNTYFTPSSVSGGALLNGPGSNYLTLQVVVPGGGGSVTFSGATTRAGARYLGVAEGGSATAGSWTTTAGTGSSVYAFQVALGLKENSPPNAPTWVTPQNSVIPADQEAYIEIAFSDPDPGDSMSASNWKRWTLDSSGNRVAGSEVDTYQPTPSTKLLISAGTLTAGTKYEFQADTLDSKGAEGPYSASLFVTAGTTPASPTFTDPISGQTIGLSSYTGKISDPTVDSSEWTLYADDGSGGISMTVLQGPVTVTAADGDVRQHTFSGLANNVPVWWSVRVKYGGLWSQPTQIRTPVSYTPPTTPTVALTEDNAGGTVAVAITNPTPGTGQPATSYNDVYQRSPAATPNADTYLPYSETGTRVATMLATNAAYVDPWPASGVAYEYQVVSVASNGTTSASGWISL